MLRLTTICLTLTLLAATASAQVPLSLNIGAKGGMNFNMLSEPNEDVINMPVPGFTGFSGGGGLAIEFMVGEFVGLEADLFYVSTAGEGDIDFRGGGTVVETIETTELHIPILLKGQVPVGTVKPFLTLGVTFVNQLEAAFTVDPNVGEINTDVEELSYSMFTFGVGVTVDLDIVRIPIEFRGLYQSLSDDPVERMTWEPENGGLLTSLGVKPNWEGQIWFMIGAEYSLSL